MIIIILYALFGDDIRLTGLPKSVDPFFFSLSSLAFSFFMIEIVLSSIGVPKYFLGFYFWLDLISTLSLMFDIGWIWDAIIGTSNSEANDA